METRLEGWTWKWSADDGDAIDDVRGSHHCSTLAFSWGTMVLVIASSITGAWSAHPRPRS